MDGRLSGSQLENGSLTPPTPTIINILGYPVHYLKSL